MVFPLKLYRVQGQSMRPTLKAGDVILVCPWLNGRAGDVIVFKKNALTMIKRIQRREGKRFYVKGDASNQSSDSDEFGAVEQEAVLGKMLFTIVRF